MKTKFLDITANANPWKIDNARVAPLLESGMRARFILSSQAERIRDERSELFDKLEAILRELQCKADARGNEYPAYETLKCIEKEMEGVPELLASIVEADEECAKLTGA